MKIETLTVRTGWLGLTLLLLTGCQPEKSTYYQGYVEGEYVYLASSVAGNLQNLAVAKGQMVEQGDLLFVLDPNPQALQIKETRQRIQQAEARYADLSKGVRAPELAVIEARLEQAEIAAERAQRDYERRSELVAIGHEEAISEEELDRTKADSQLQHSKVEAIRAELETARLGGRSDALMAARKEVAALEASLKQQEWQLDQKRVVAPEGGVIQQTLFRVGEHVPALRPVVSLLPADNIKIRFFVPQSRLPSVQLGAVVQVHLDGMASRVGARISYISTQTEFTPPVIYSKESRSKLVFLMEAIPEPGAAASLRPGQPLEVYLD